MNNRTEGIVRAYCGLGANVGDAAGNVLAAMREIGSLPATRLVRASALYHTSPVGYADQPDFINAVIAVDTGLVAPELLQSLKEIERRLGRIPRPQWHQREIDIDILTYGSDVLSWDDVAIPHPRIHERRFVLLPFNEIGAEVIIPGYGAPIAQLLEQCTDSGTVARLDRPVILKEIKH